MSTSRRQKERSIAPLVRNLGTIWKSVAVLPAGGYSSTHSLPIELEDVWASDTLVAVWRKGSFLDPAGIPTPERPVRSLVTILTIEKLICNLERMLFKKLNCRG
jgi:hypothetical protein